VYCNPSSKRKAKQSVVSFKDAEYGSISIELH
jgi:hypothetical protein